MRPISREWIGQLLDQKHIAVLVPGGVQEVLYMEHGKEVVYLSTRTGFVRLAVKHGAPLVPVFAFGQTRTYDWVRPGPPLVPNWLVERVSRTFGAVPIGMFGRYGSSMPHRAPMTVVIGRPIEVPQMDEPPKELVEQLLQRFIEDIKVGMGRGAGGKGRRHGARGWGWGWEGLGMQGLHTLWFSGHGGPCKYGLTARPW